MWKIIAQSTIKIFIKLLLMCYTVLKAEIEQEKLHQIPAFKECALQREKSTDNRQVKSKYLSGTINQMLNKEKIKQNNRMERDGKGANFIQGHWRKSF